MGGVNATALMHAVMSKLTAELIVVCLSGAVAPKAKFAPIFTDLHILRLRHLNKLSIAKVHRRLECFYMIACQSFFLLFSGVNFLFFKKRLDQGLTDWDWTM